MTPVPTPTLAASEARVTGRVVDNNGVAISCASISVSQYYGSANLYATSDIQGYYSVGVPAGTTTAGTPTPYRYDVTAHKSGYTQQIIPGVSAGTAGQTYTANVQLVTNNATLSGTVRDGSGAPVSGVQVSLSEPSSFNSGYSNTQYGVTSAQTQSDGTFSLSVAAGGYSSSSAYVSGGTSAYQSDATGSVTLSTGGNTQNFTLPTLTFSPTSCNTATCSVGVSGQGYFPSGSGGQSVSLYLQGGSGNGYATYVGTVTPDSNGAITGTFSFSAPSAGTYTVNAYQTGTAASPASNAPNRQINTSATYNVSVGPTATAAPGQYIVTGRVLNENSTPIPNAFVYAYPGPSTTPGPSGSYATADAQGNYSMYLANGAYDLISNESGYTEVSIASVNYTSSTPAVVTQNVTVHTNDATVNGTLRDGFGTPVSNASITLFVDGRYQNSLVAVSGSTDASGSYSIPLASGTYNSQIASQSASSPTPDPYSSRTDYRTANFQVTPGANTNSLPITMGAVQITGAACYGPSPTPTATVAGAWSVGSVDFTAPGTTDRLASRLTAALSTTQTPTLAPTSTGSPTTTPVPGGTPTATSTLLATGTAATTATPAVTTPTATNTATSTVTTTATATATRTVTATATSTSSPTLTSIVVATPTRTPTPAPTRTAVPLTANATSCSITVSGAGFPPNTAVNFTISGNSGYILGDTAMTDASGSFSVPETFSAPTQGSYDISVSGSDSTNQDFVYRTGAYTVQ